MNPKRLSSARPPIRFAQVLVVAFVVCAGLAGPARAAEAVRLPEEIRLMLTAEDWVITETAEVAVTAQLTLVDQDPAAVRRDVTAALKRIDNAPWRIVRFERGSDAAGATRWTIRAEGRLPQARLDGLAARVRKESGPGKAFRVASIDTTPSLAEREAVLRSLRGQIYAMARNEVEVAKVLWPGRTVTIARVEFMPGPGVTPRPVPYMARAEAVGSSAAPAAATTQEKLILSAWVTLTPPPRN